MTKTCDLVTGSHADPAIQTAGLCHACYGTDGFAHAILGPEQRAVLIGLIGEDAERLVYLYGSVERTDAYPRLAQPGAISFRDRFTRETIQPPEADVRAFVELTAANELDVLRQNQVLADAHGERLLGLLTSTRQRLSDAAWESWQQLLHPELLP